ncbi:hypothetical protein ASNO1_58040 [Corallococcus caeni]|uniref:Uncharacterized protein n=1 Tax=Corallococcus caeni TaxID=3082388 RepID=A0ABQ6QZT0_9BACT|nr:hypothetical protein ASNO1_58040 [Corallococcus sp. NO1]
MACFTKPSFQDGSGSAASACKGTATSSASAQGPQAGCIHVRRLTAASCPRAIPDIRRVGTKRHHHNAAWRAREKGPLCPAVVLKEHEAEAGHRVLGGPRGGSRAAGGSLQRSREGNGAAQAPHEPQQPTACPGSRHVSSTACAAPGTEVGEEVEAVATDLGSHASVR